jgi:hypothetical protein
MHTSAMIDAHPTGTDLDKDLLARAVDALVACSQACTACADACLGEEMVAELRKCIRTDLDCADVCDTTARVLSRHTTYDALVTRAVLTACVQVCGSCGDECESHAEMHEHCKVCAQACRACEEACAALLESIA